MARQACITGFPDVSPADAWLLCRAHHCELHPAGPRVGVNHNGRL